MTDYYLDASALVKRYADEPGSDLIRRITNVPSDDSVLVADITLAEVAAAMAAKHRTPGGISLEQRDRAVGLFLQECEERFLLVAVDRTVIDRAVDLTQAHRLRGYDAVQLATALVVTDTFRARGLLPPTFVADDADLLAAAQVENLPILRAAERQ